MVFFLYPFFSHLHDDLPSFVVYSAVIAAQLVFIFEFAHLFTRNAAEMTVLFRKVCW